MNLERRGRAFKLILRIFLFVHRNLQFTFLCTIRDNDLRPYIDGICQRETKAESINGSGSAKLVIGEQSRLDEEVGLALENPM